NGFHYRRSLSAGTALASGQQDVGHEGVATRRRVLSLPSFIQFARCGVFGLVLADQESPPYVTAIRVRSLKTNAYGIYSLNSRILFNNSIMELTQIGALAMNRRHFFIHRSRDVRLNGYCWMPEQPNEAKTVIQIAHGMAEHILRYEQFAEYLTTQGYIVYGHDHRCHGGSVMAPDDWGFFADSNGFEKVVED